MGDGSCAPLTNVVAAALAGDVLRTAACTFWKAASKLRWVCKGIRTGGRLEARPQAAAGGAPAAAPGPWCNNRGPVEPCPHPYSPPGPSPSTWAPHGPLPRAAHR
jgi:hypothetical protein